MAVEKDKIRGAVRTDFILSTEIIVITLGTVAASPFLTQFTVLAGVALLMTVGVYGLVAGIVKIDDLGLYLSQRTSSVAQALATKAGSRLAAGRAPADEKPDRARHAGHVSGRRRHSGARLA